MSAPTVPPTTDPATPATWVVLPPSHTPEEEACYVDESGNGTSQYHFEFCNADTWPGPIIPRTVTEVTAAPTATTAVPVEPTLPVTGSETGVALVGGACLLLGLFLVRITHRNS
jgi:LPXTG-motif cell wall-anchored protein